MAEVGLNRRETVAILTFHQPGLHQVVVGQTTWKSAAHGTDTALSHFFATTVCCKLKMQIGISVNP